MTIDRASLRRAIEARKLADWVLTERRREQLSVASHGAAWRSDRSEHLRVLVRRDLPSGRGTGVVEVQEPRGEAPALIARAVALAEAAIEPVWITPPPAAPARVALLDELAAGSLGPAAEALRQALHQAAERAGVALVSWRCEVARDELALGSAQGFEVSWKQSELRATATVGKDGQLGGLHRRARRLADLELPGALAALAAELAPREQAAALPDVPVILELGGEAMLGDDERGVWETFALLASAPLQRRNAGATIALGARRGAAGTAQTSQTLATLATSQSSQSSLTVSSDGALPYGLRSAPVGDEAEAVRRFRLFADGQLGEPGMGPREAARRGGAPNGGVRNLVIGPGAAGDGPEEGAAFDGAGMAILDVRRLRWLQLDAGSGRAEGELELAFDRQRGTALRGGRFAIDLARALVGGQRSTATLRRGSYQGPAWIRLGPVQLR